MSHNRIPLLRTSAARPRGHPNGARMRVLFATVAATALFLAGSGSLGPQAAAASAQALRPVGPVTGAALRQLVVGHTEYGTGSHGPFSKTFAANGDLTGFVTNGGNRYDITGKWLFRGNLVCDSWELSSGSYQSPQVCQAFSWDGKSLFSKLKLYGAIQKIAVKFR